ncbi:hypothetical protein ILYODFUR_001139 [Ilyodon furcidens]|uniref:Uncharacterized protein n=1 Tax=Ilyodon furcidens TaxID=33524 RepID=A0ABV0SHJ2_9TELE
MMGQRQTSTEEADWDQKKLLLIFTVHLHAAEMQVYKKIQNNKAISKQNPTGSEAGRESKKRYQNCHRKDTTKRHGRHRVEQRTKENLNTDKGGHETIGQVIRGTGNR